MHRAARAVVAVLDQKVAVLAVVPQALYTSVCPLVGASIGQHTRHSLDHVERAAAACRDLRGSAAATTLRYDDRVRGSAVNSSAVAITAALAARETILAALAGRDELLDARVDVSFNLSGDDDVQDALRSTLARELAFVAHHAFHHAAMVRIIAVHHLGLDADSLPPDLGRAPSTLRFDQATKR
ncbi:hypothetical protein M885DRAFT_438979 [Pelagophyceae sp. CCMP2097]|nr:hypothetical protein M885DRAFT_438979 [Pelagophyceae sp. CCMP2097]